MVIVIVVLVFLAGAGGTGWFGESTNLVRIVTQVAKGHLEFIDKVKEVGHYAINYDDCFAEIDKREVSCPDRNVLTAVKVQVEDDNGEVNIIIPEIVVGTVYGAGIPANNHWRITIARHGDACSPGSHDIRKLAQLPALVTLFTACYPLKEQGNKNI